MLPSLGACLSVAGPLSGAVATEFTIADRELGAFIEQARQMLDAEGVCARMIAVEIAGRLALSDVSERTFTVFG